MARNDDDTLERPAVCEDVFNASPRRQVCVQIAVLARTLRGYFDRRISGLNLTRSQWNMIAAVGQAPGATQRVLSDRLEMSEASAGRLIDRLCADGLLERHERADDRRARSVYLADAALPLMRTSGEIISSYETQLFEGFTDDEIEQLRGYLNRIYANTTGRDG